MNFLDKFTTVHKLPGTFKAAMRHARRHEPKEPTPERNRIPRPRMSWLETRDLLRNSGERAAMVKPTRVPIEYDDPKAQAAFEAVYRNRLHLLRVPGP
jgi:hypothetical protein